MKRVLPALALTLAASTADAAVVSFDFTAPRATVADVTRTVNGVTAVATPASNNIRINSAGIGVTTNPEGGRLGAGETILFTTSHRFDALSVDIWETGNQDEDFRVTVNGVSVDYTIAGGTGGRSTVTFDLSALVPAGGLNAFSITGLEPNAAGNRGVRVAGVTINAIPVPATGALMLAGLLGFGALRHRT